MSYLFFGKGTTGITNYTLSATVSKASKDSTRVRINLRELESSSGSVSATDIDTLEVYQTFFNDLGVEVQRMQALN